MFRLAVRYCSEIFNLWRSADLSTACSYLLATLLNIRSVLKERSLRPVDTVMSVREWTFRLQDGPAIQIPGIAFVLAREMIGRKIYEYDDRFRIKVGDRVIDLGANVGLFSVIGAARGASVLAIEAQSGFLKEIESLSQRNRLSNSIRIMHGIVAPGVGAISVPEIRDKASHWCTEPPVVDMNTLLKTIGWDTVDFVKADIEGSEFGIMTEDSGWLDCVKRIAMEIHADYGNVFDIISCLESRGFEVLLTDLEKRPISRLNGGLGYLYAIKK